ncbi:MATE family efflux transporter [Photobacterium profundum]|nr:MATE family efflux transporter [Photobacterium profundum]
MAGYGTAAVASWALLSRFEMLSLVVILSLTMSMPPMIGRFIGEGNLESIDRLVKSDTIFILALQTGFAFLFILLAKPLSALMSSDSHVQELLITFFKFVPFCYGPLGVCMLIVSVSNAVGQPKVALWLSIIRLFVLYLPAIWIGAEFAQVQGMYISIFIANTLTGVVAWHLYKKCMETISGTLNPIALS